MKNSLNSRTHAMAATAILSLVATVLLVLNFDGTWLHPDTAQALSVARNFQNGDGFKTGIIYYEEHYSLNAWPAPQTVFPIGYPSMMAGLAGIGIPLRTTPAVIGMTGFFLVPLLICIASMRMGCKPVAAFSLATMWLCFPMLWHNVWERQTEMMFVSLTLSSLILLQSESIKYRRLFLAGLLAAVAMTLRYAGVFWLISVGLAFLIQIPQRRFAAIKHAVTFFVIPTIVVASLFARNIMLVGDLKGGSTKEVHRTLKEAATNAYYAASRLSGLDKTNLVTGHAAELAAATGFCLLAIAIVVSLVRLITSGRRKALAIPPIGYSVVFLYIAVSLTALIGLEKTTSINLSPRMLFPLIPFVLTASADVVSRLLAVIPDEAFVARSQRRVVIVGFILMVGSVLGGQFRAADEVRNYVHRFGVVSEIVAQTIEIPTGSTTPRELLRGKHILSDEPDMLGEALQQGVVGLTSDKYTNRIWTDDEVITLIRKYQINRLVLFPAIQPKEELRFFDSVATEANKGISSRLWLQPVVMSSEIQIYAVRESLLLTQHN